MKTLKNLIFFMLLISQSAYAQTAEQNNNKTAATTETINKSTENNSLTLSIPMMGNIRVPQADKQLRESTLPLHVKEDYGQVELLSQRDSKEEHNADSSIDYPGDK